MATASIRYFHAGHDLLKVAKKDDGSEMLIMFHPLDSRLPPTLVSRFQCNLKQLRQLPFSVVKSNLREKDLGPILQKVQAGDMSVVVSEYAIKPDYFQPVPPDDESKCIRRFGFFFHAADGVSKVVMEMSSMGTHSRTTFTLRETRRDGIFLRIAVDRNEREAKVARVFREFHDEVWLINDSILLKALMDCEEEMMKEKIKERVEEASKTRNNKKQEYFVTEDSLWEKRMEPSRSLQTSQDLVTEDSLLEKRFFE